VTGFEFGRNRVSAVKTTKGDIQCEIIVNCSGMWGHQIGEMLGVNTPVVLFQHQYMVTDPIEGTPKNLPTIRDKDNLIYYKGEVGGLVMGGYERNGIPWAIDEVPNEFTSRLLDSNYDHFMQLAQPAVQCGVHP
jgi:4-methylaminobutanoate oxidase (formaldehyde-forming)